MKVLAQAAKRADWARTKGGGSRRAARRVRVDGFGYAGYTTSARYDSLLAKLIVHADDLSAATGKARRASGRLEYGLQASPTVQSAPHVGHGRQAQRGELDEAQRWAKLVTELGIAPEEVAAVRAMFFGEARRQAHRPDHEVPHPALPLVGPLLASELEHAAQGHGDGQFAGRGMHAFPVSVEPSAQ